MVSTVLFVLIVKLVLAFPPKSRLSSMTRFSSKTYSTVPSNFEGMMNRFKSYTDDDINRIENERLRQLIYGGQDALDEPKVVRAFQILYEDVLPVRLGGDILFNLLQKSITSARSQSRTEISPRSYTENIQQTGSSIIKSKIKRKLMNQIMRFAEGEDKECTVTTTLFPSIDTDQNGSISVEEFKSWVDSVVLSEDDNDLFGLEKELGDGSEAVFREIDANRDGQLSLQEFRLWTSGKLDDGCSDEIPVDDKNRKSRDRYLQMVSSFNKWGDMYPVNQSLSDEKGNKDGRISSIVSGCFAGAKNPGVVKALGILYEDYMPLRLAGDLIFGLVEKQMNMKQT